MAYKPFFEPYTCYLLFVSSGLFMLTPSDARPFPHIFARRKYDADLLTSKNVRIVDSNKDAKTFMNKQANMTQRWLFDFVICRTGQRQILLPPTSCVSCVLRTLALPFPAAWFFQRGKIECSVHPYGQRTVLYGRFLVLNPQAVTRERKGRNIGSISTMFFVLFQSPVSFHFSGGRQ